MDNRENKIAYLETVRGIRDRLQAIGATSGPDWDDLVWARAEVPRLEAELHSDGSARIPPTAATPKPARPDAVGRPFREADVAHLDAVYKRGLRKSGLQAPSSGLATVGALAMVRMLTTGPRALSPAMTAQLERLLVNPR